MLASSLCFSICLTAAPSQADPAKARLGRLAFIAFECAAYAEFSGQSKEQTRLFDLGIENSRAFVDAYSSNQITKEDFWDQIPLAVTAALVGPSKDFIVGRIFEAARSSANVTVTQYDENGKALPRSEWKTDPSLIKSIAEDRFFKENCSLIR
jgi:hypothetical protein